MGNTISLRLNYTRQSIYRHALEAIGKTHTPRTSSRTYHMTEAEFAKFVEVALGTTDSPFSLRSMDFRFLPASQQPVQQELPLGNKSPADQGQNAMEALLTELFGSPVKLLTVEEAGQVMEGMKDMAKASTSSQECQCDGCQFGKALAAALNEATLVVPPTEDMIAKATAWNEKLDFATATAMEHHYEITPRSVTHWEAFRYLEQHQGIPLWPSFRPRKAFMDLPANIIWQMARKLRQDIMDTLV